jgi:hypothetical protein
MEKMEDFGDKIAEVSVKMEELVISLVEGGHSSKLITDMLDNAKAKAIEALLESEVLKAPNGIYEFEIWSEGYHANEGRSGATMHGKMNAKNFPEACDKFALRNADFDTEYDKERLTYWGCRLYPHEFLARRSFG